MIKLKLDENLSRHLKPPLAALGFDVTTVVDENLLSRPDTQIARAAADEKRILLTLDLGFGDLRKYPPGSHPGIVVFRPRSLGPLAVNEFVESTVRDTDRAAVAGCTVIVEPSRIRVRKPQPGSRTQPD